MSFSDYQGCFMLDENCPKKQEKYTRDYNIPPEARQFMSEFTVDTSARLASASARHKKKGTSKQKLKEQPYAHMMSEIVFDTVAASSTAKASKSSSARSAAGADRAVTVRPEIHSAYSKARSTRPTGITKSSTMKQTLHGSLTVNSLNMVPYNISAIRNGRVSNVLRTERMAHAAFGADMLALQSFVNQLAFIRGSMATNTTPRPLVQHASQDVFTGRSWNLAPSASPIRLDVRDLFEHRMQHYLPAQTAAPALSPVPSAVSSIDIDSFFTEDVEEEADTALQFMLDQPQEVSLLQ